MKTFKEFTEETTHFVSGDYIQHEALGKDPTDPVYRVARVEERGSLTYLHLDVFGPENVVHQQRVNSLDYKKVTKSKFDEYIKTLKAYDKAVGKVNSDKGHGIY